VDPDVEGVVVDPAAGAAPGEPVPPGVAGDAALAPVSPPLAPELAEPVLEPAVALPEVPGEDAVDPELSADGAVDVDGAVALGLLLDVAADPVEPVLELVSACSVFRSQPANMTLSNPTARTALEAFQIEFIICPFANVDNVSTLRLSRYR
jgi:hypothetical protein